RGEARNQLPGEQPGEKRQGEEAGGDVQESEQKRTVAGRGGGGGRRSFGERQEPERQGAGGVRAEKQSEIAGGAIIRPRRGKERQESEKQDEKRTGRQTDKPDRIGIADGNGEGQSGDQGNDHRPPLPVRP